MRQIWTVLVAAFVIVGCTPAESDADVASKWRHPDGTAISSAEVAEARNACVRAATRELGPAEAGFTNDPAFRPGGEGLEPRGALESMNSSPWRQIGRMPVPLADCLEAKGYVPVR
ncbi:MAG TPA: hypothetical protein VHT04_03320 [Stellaceae bacterium]|jgi:hypothetical protein|nr:hypothetical protein [Stellaceae bacterium]